MTRKCALCGSTKNIYAPKADPAIRQQWSIFLGKEISSKERICKNHFSLEDFENATTWLFYKAANKPARLDLKSTAVPRWKEPRELETTRDVQNTSGQQCKNQDAVRVGEKQQCRTTKQRTIEHIDNQAADSIMERSQITMAKKTEEKLYFTAQSTPKKKLAISEHSTISVLSLTEDRSEQTISEYHPSVLSASGSIASDEDANEICQDEIDNKIQRSCIPYMETKVAVFWSTLEELLRVCPNCPSRGKTVKLHVKTVGAAVLVDRLCTECGSTTPWRSSPAVGRKNAINVLQSSSILFTGSTARKCIRLFKFMGLLSISSRTFDRHQNQFLHQTIANYWKTQQSATYALCKERQLTAAGDARCDSMGHCAKYGSYTLMDVKTGRVITNQLVQVTEVANSNAMEMEGLKRCIAEAAENACTPNILITDRHVQIRKYIRETYGNDRINKDLPYIDHVFDVWHVVKSFKKDLEKAAKADSSGIIAAWRRSIVTHVYWCAASTPSGNKDEIEAKYLSIMNHVAGIHKHRNALFPKCLHGKRKRGTKKKNYFTLESEAYLQLSNIVENPRRLKDIRQLSVTGQTSSLEAFHSVCNQYAPKMHHYHYKGMKSRLLMAAIHTNANADNKRNDPGRLMVVYPKAKGGEHSIKKQKKASIYEYVWELMDAVFTASHDTESDSEDEPQFMNKRFKKSETEEKRIISEYQSRFKDNNQ